MRVLFFMRSTVYVRNFESTLRLLAERGHEVHVVADPHNLPESNDLIARLCGELPLIRHSLAPAIPFSAWSFLGFELRRAVDYLRYLGPEFVDATKLRKRAARNAPSFILEAVERPLLRSPIARRLLGRVLRWSDRAIPREPAIDAFIRIQNADLVLVTPLVEPGSPQADYLRSARGLGIRTGLCVYSWDNLTNKGLIHDCPDLVTVWNEAMKEEAITLHSIPADRVAVTGAVAYDHWFTWAPRASREAFCERVGLPCDRSYVLYLCSSKFIAPDEVSFVWRWLEELRAVSDTLREVGVLVRPHPQNAEAWETADLSAFGPVAIWPRAGANPVDEDSRADYYDSIHHSAGVVGVNTSAQIESAIVGRGVYTVLAPEFRATQEGTLHFRHLRQGGDGLLHVAETFADHVAQLEAAVHEPSCDDRGARFVEAFVRPHGHDEAATPRLVGALEATAARGRRPNDRGPWWGPLVRPALARAADRLAHTDRARKEKATRRDRMRQQRVVDLAAHRSARRAAKHEAEAAREHRKQQANARLAAERLAGEKVAAAANGHYQHVRDHVRRMRGMHHDAPVVLTATEQHVVAALAHLWDATPETVARLRRWCEPISGVRAADYDDASSDLRLRLGRELRMLRKQVGPDLFVPEPSILGGFGCFKRGERYNEDTLKHFKALVALQDGAVLGEFRNTSSRRLVWEIGGGWGGFAYQFKTVCPNVTYLITGIPELFLVSAVYLMTAFPGARVHFFCGQSIRDATWQNWEEVDFIFVPESALAMLRPPRVDLTLDVMALRNMTEERVLVHVQRAFGLRSRYFYSLLPADGAAQEVPRIRKALEPLYWPNAVPPRVEHYPPVSSVVGGPGLESDYAHVAGWRRLRA